MNRYYIAGSILIGLGALCCYHAGMQDGKKEQEHDTWSKADEEETEKDHVRSER